MQTPRRQLPDKYSFTFLRTLKTSDGGKCFEKCMSRVCETLGELCKPCLLCFYTKHATACYYYDPSGFEIRVLPGLVRLSHFQIMKLMSFTVSMGLYDIKKQTKLFANMYETFC